MSSSELWHTTQKYFRVTKGQQERNEVEMEPKDGTELNQGI